MPLPTPRFVISSPIHMRSVVPAVSVVTMRTSSPRAGVEDALAAEQERVTGRLRRRENDGQVPRVLRDLGVPGLAFLLELGELRDDHGHELEDDRGRDVRHDPEREQRELRERAAREEVEQAEDRVAPGVEVVLDRLRVDARGRDPRPEPVDRQDEGGEEDAAAELRDAPGVGEPGEHLAGFLLRLFRLGSGSAAASAAGSSASSASGSSTSAAGAAGLCFFRFFSTGSPRSHVTLPPAASIFSIAVFEKPCAEIASFFVSSPSPSTFTSIESLLIRPALFRASGVTSAPASKRASRSRTLTGCVCVRNGPIGIASAEVLPRSFGSFMSIGIWPPSKPAGILCEPARDFWPLIPRPA